MSFIITPGKSNHADAGISLLATLLTVEYSGHKYDVWDLALVAIVGMSLLRGGWSRDTDWLVMLMGSLSFGITVTVILGVVARFCELVVGVDIPYMSSETAQFHQLIDRDFVLSVIFAVGFWLVRRRAVFS